MNPCFTKKFMNIPLTATMLLLMGGCQSMTGETAGENISDSSITTAVKTNLAKERVGSLTKVEVDTVRKTVYLTGVVDSPDWKDRAGQIASTTSGVEKVVNNLQVRNRPAGSEMSEPGTSPSSLPGQTGTSGMSGSDTGSPSR